MSNSTAGSPGKLTVINEGHWVEHQGGVYRCLVYLTPQEGGGVLVKTTLPGVTASGNTEQEALEAAKLALTHALRAAKAAGHTPAWGEAPLGAWAAVRSIIVRL